MFFFTYPGFLYLGVVIFCAWRCLGKTISCSVPQLFRKFSPRRSSLLHSGGKAGVLLLRKNKKFFTLHPSFFTFLYLCSKYR